MPTITYDHQIFSMQRYGGISRYFSEISSRIPKISDLHTTVVAPIHFNEHLRTCDTSIVGTFQSLRFRGAGRLYRGLNRAFAPLAMGILHPALVHWTYYWPGHTGRRVRTVVTVYDMIHELFPGDFAPTDATTYNKRQSVEHADHVICISESTKADLIRLFDVPSSKVSVTHLGFSSAFSDSEASGKRSHRGQRPYLLYVGQRAGYKGFARLVEAYAGSSVLRSSLDVLAFGGSSFGAAEIALFTRLGLREGSVQHVSGDDHQLAIAYREARAFVYPSCYEGFGIPPLEAMSCGCPVACSNTSSIPEVVGDAAELFDPSDVGSMRAALERVCFDEARRLELVAAGNRRSNFFSWDRCARETAAVYDSILKG